MSSFSPCSSESLHYETLSSPLQKSCDTFLALVAAEATSRTAPRGTISFPLWVLTPQPSRPETRAGLDDSRLPTARVRQAGNADNRQLHQQGMPASNTSHHRQRAPGDLCQGLRGLNPAQHFHCKSTEKPSWLFSIRTAFTENNF